MKFPKTLYVSICDDDEDSLLAWPEIDDTNDGDVAIYELREVAAKRTVSEIQKQGSKEWMRAE